MSELLSADLPVNRVLDFPPRLLPRYQRVLPVAKLEHLADHAVIDSPGCCLIGTKIVFANGGECFEFETNTMLEHSRAQKSAWQISVHKVSLRDDELRLLRTKQIVQPELYPAPTDFVFARVEQRKF